MITKIDRTFMKMSRAKIDDALKDLGDELGVVFQTGNGSYDGSTGHFKLEIKTIGENGEAVNPNAKTFQTYARMYGLSPDDLGRQFTSRGKTFEITGLNTRARRFPIQANALKTAKDSNSLRKTSRHS